MDAKASVVNSIENTFFDELEVTVMDRVLANGKEPWLAVLLSTVFPGFGQIYAGKWIRGVVFCAIALGTLTAIGWFMLNPSSSIQLPIQLGIGFMLFSIANLFDAHRCARRSNDSEFEYERKMDSDPWLAVFLSNILPGLGHAYQGTWGFAILFFLLVISTRALTNAIPLFAVIAVALSIFCFYHAYTTAPSERAKSQTLIVRVCAFLLVANLFSVAIALSVRAFAVEARYIPSEAMVPTLQIDDRLLIDKLTYRFEAPSRGEIITFYAPQAALDVARSTTKDVYIKRIIGLPGETVEVKDGKVLVDGVALEESYIKEPVIYTWGPEVVPQDTYFVLGDNRNSSLDSHIWGFLPSENVLGRASKIFWPPARQGTIE